MFQYAAGLALAERTGAELWLDTSAFKEYTTWPYQLDRLRVPQERVRMGVGSAALRRKGRRFYDRWLRMRGRLFQEATFHLDDRFFNLSPPIEIAGYYQSFRYFEGHETSLREHFQLASPLGAAGARVLDLIAGTTCPVSVHVRRGDYLTGNARSVYVELGSSYYGAAMEAVRCRVAPLDPTFFVFSDDPDHARERFAGPGVVVVQGDSSRPFDDLHLMSRCSHHILANSTFSWWGAWLGAGSRSHTIAPASWFADPALAGEFRAEDLFPPPWSTL
jgi:hypothetical protein